MKREAIYLARQLIILFGLSFIKIIAREAAWSTWQQAKRSMGSRHSWRKRTTGWCKEPDIWVSGLRGDRLITDEEDLGGNHQFTGWEHE